MLPLPCEPTPMHPMVIFPLGAAAPNTDEGTMYGNATAPAAAPRT